MHPTGKLVHLHAMYTKTGIFAVCKYNILRDPSYMSDTPKCGFSRESVTQGMKGLWAIGFKHK